MKNIVKFGALFVFSFLVLGACGNFGKNADEPNREDATLVRETEKEGGSLETGNSFGFDDFELEIDVDGHDVIEAKYKMDRNLEAIYRNNLAGLNLKDDEAMVKLNEMFLDILFTKDTTPKEAKEKLLKWFGVDTYTEFDLEVYFDDGTILDIEEKK